MTAGTPFACVLDIRASLGECPVWSAAEQALYWVDIRLPAVRRWRGERGSATESESSRRIGEAAP